MRSPRATPLLLLLLGSALVALGCSESAPPDTGVTVSQPSRGPSPLATTPPATLSPTVGPTAAPSATPVLPSARVSVPILYYHRVEATPADFASWSSTHKGRFLRYDVLPAAFTAQLDWLVANGYTTILPRDLVAYWDAGSPLPPKPVILTFDDGFPSWVTHVLPALQARGMVAEFYLTLDAIAVKAVHWADIRALAAAGNGIGAHDVHHVQLAGLGKGHDATADMMWHEVNDIRAIIRAHVGTAPDSMAYVGGGFDATLVALVKQAGYSSARSIRRGVVQTTTQRWALRVVRIGGHDDVRDPVKETLVDGLPTFTARMRGVSDK